MTMHAEPPKARPAAQQALINQRREKRKLWWANLSDEERAAFRRKQVGGLKRYHAGKR